ncbi:response regulator transcription factor [Gemmobacter sp.]|uniref:response regulator transcription factor n=1 Tax=Gemmobacter sp. TaxID=1898957 RepID=UPI003919B750
MRHLMQRASNRDIAEKLQISEKTVKSYMTQIMQKCHARNRLEVVLNLQKGMPSG